VLRSLGATSSVPSPPPLLWVSPPATVPATGEEDPLCLRFPHSYCCHCLRQVEGHSLHVQQRESLLRIPLPLHSEHYCTEQRTVFLHC